MSGLCARASVTCFFFKDNRTVILTRQDFLANRTADGDLFFTLLNNININNILAFRKSLLSYSPQSHPCLNGFFLTVFIVAVPFLLIPFTII